MKDANNDYLFKLLFSKNLYWIKWNKKKCCKIECVDFLFYSFFNFKLIISV